MAICLYSANWVGAGDTSSKNSSKIKYQKAEKTHIILVGGVPLWLQRLRTWHCHCCDSGYSYGLGSVPSPGASTCCGHSPKKKKIILAGREEAVVLKHLFMALLSCLSSSSCRNCVRTWGSLCLPYSHIFGKGRLIGKMRFLEAV